MIINLNSTALTEVRIISTGGDPNEGRIEYNVGGVWGDVCKVGWSAVDAEVACRQMGYDGVSDIIPRSIR